VTGYKAFNFKTPLHRFLYKLTGGFQNLSWRHWKWNFECDL